MPFDPLSIIGYFGTTLGIVGFLASGVESVHKRWLNYNDFPTTYKQYHNNIQTSREIYNAWIYIWTQDGKIFSDADYVYLWGDKGFDNVQNRQTIVRDRLAEAVKILRLPDDKKMDINNDERTTWRRYADGLLTQEQLNAKMPRVRDKIRHALYRHTQLELSIANIKAAVDDLVTYSHTVYQNNHQSSPSSKRVHSDLNLKSRLEDWSQFMRKVHRWQHENSDGQDGRWQLELQDTDQEQLLDQFKEDLAVAVSLSGSGEKNLVTRGSIQWYPGAVLQEDLVIEWAEVQTGPAPTPLAAILKTLASNEASLSATRLERSEAALRLVNWVLALWGTSWTADLCTCTVHYTPQSNGTFEVSLASIVNTDLSQRRQYGYLGLALAELLTSRVQHELGEQHINLAAVVSDEKISREVVARFNCISRHAKTAIEHCFHMEHKMLSGNATLTPLEFEKDVEKILRPLQKHYNTQSQHREAQMRHKWYRDHLEQSGMSSHNF